MTIDDLIRDLRSEHPSDVGRWHRANRAADAIEAMRRALEPFANGIVTPDGTIIGLMREDVARAREVLAEMAH